MLQASTLLHTPEAKDTVLELLEQTRPQQDLRIAGYVLMPGHVHLLTTEPTCDTLATFLQIFKQRTSLQLKPEDQKQFWQRRYYDFNVSANEKHIEKLRSIHRNPVAEVSSPHRKTQTGRLPMEQLQPLRRRRHRPVEIESEWTARRPERANLSSVTQSTDG